MEGSPAAAKVGALGVFAARLVPWAVRARRRDPRGERVEWDEMVVKKVRDRPAGISGRGRE